MCEGAGASDGTWTRHLFSVYIISRVAKENEAMQQHRIAPIELQDIRRGVHGIRWRLPPPPEAMSLVMHQRDSLRSVTFSGIIALPSFSRARTVLVASRVQKCFNCQQFGVCDTTPLILASFVFTSEFRIVIQMRHEVFSDKWRARPVAVARLYECLFVRHRGNK